MKKIKIKLSSDKQSLFIKSSNAILNKTAIINLNSSPLINFVVEKENNKNVLSLQTDSSLIELMEFNTIEEAVEAKQYIEKKIYCKNYFNSIYNVIKKITILLISISIILGVPTYTYFKIQQISKMNAMISNQMYDSGKPNNINGLQNRLNELTNKPNLTPEENKELDTIQNKLESINTGVQVSPQDEFSKIQNRLIELSKKPKDSLTEDEKKEILDMRTKLISLDKNNAIKNNSETPVNNKDKNPNENTETQQNHLNNMLEEIKEKSFGKN